MEPRRPSLLEQVDGRIVCRSVALAGGLVNDVRRVWLEDGTTLVVKSFGPHLAGAPSIPLDQRRFLFEVAALQWFDGVGVPRLLATGEFACAMQDIGDLPDLGAVLRAASSTEGAQWTNKVADWLRTLHTGPLPVGYNTDIQQTRLRVQYCGVGAWLDAVGVPDARVLGALAQKVGEELMSPGPTFVMGDLWPPAIRIGPDGRFWVIDWEMCSCGHAAQDVGHFAAHLDLIDVQRRPAAGWGDLFLTAYGGLPPEEARAADVHRACEVLARTIGSFAMPWSAEQRGRLVDQALARLRDAAAN